MISGSQGVALGCHIWPFQGEQALIHTLSGFKTAIEQQWDLR